MKYTEWGREEPTPILLKPILCSSGLSWFHPLVLLCFKPRWRGGGYRRRALHPGHGLAFGSEIPAAHEWAGLCSWPCLFSWPGSREAQGGELTEIIGPQPLAVVASGQL